MFRCVRCKMPLPLMDAEIEEQASWICATCGTKYRAAIDPRSTPEERRQVRLAEVPRRNPTVNVDEQE